MARQKNDGKGRLGGRAKGTPNRTTGDLRKWVSEILDSGKDKFMESLDQLESGEYVRVFTGLLNYVLPKQAPTTPEIELRKEIEATQELLLSLPDEAVDRIAKRLQQLNEKEYEAKNK